MAKNTKQSLNNSLQHIRLSERRHQQILQEIVEEGKMKRKVLGSAIAIALIILLSIGAVYALFHSQIAEVLQRNYSNDRLHELEQGKLAQLDEIFQVKGVDFHFGEAILKDGKLFLAVDISTKEDFNLEHAGLENQDNTKLFYTSDLNFEAIGVDKDNLLPTGSYGATTEKVDDKHWKEVYELSPSFHLPQSESIFVKVGLSVHKKGTPNYYIPDEVILLEIQPKIEVPKLTESSPAPAKLEGEGYEIIVLEEYKEKGELPIYAAIARNLEEVLKPELFNDNKIQHKGDFIIEFGGKEEAELQYAPEMIYYSSYSGSYEHTYSDGSKAYLKKRSLANQVGSLASQALRGLDLRFVTTAQWNSIPRSMPEKESLTHISFAEARKKAESLLLAHGLEEYTLTAAIDMDLDRIQTEGKKYEEDIKAGKFFEPELIEYKKATAAEEGYFLEYHRYGMENASEGNYIAHFYITEKGIVFASIRDSYKKGEILRQSSKLQEPTDIVEGMPSALAKHGESINNLQIQSIRLCYQTKLEKAGLIFTPIWQVLYYTEENQDSLAWANFDAIDGKLLYAIFK